MPRWLTLGGSARPAGACAAMLVAAAAIACAARTPVRRPAARRTANGDVAAERRSGGRDASSRIVRIALASRLGQVRLSSDGEWAFYATDERTLLATPQPGESWVLERDGGGVSARREDSGAGPVSGSGIVVRPISDGGGGAIAFNGKRWRGELLVSVAEGGLLVVNRLRMDDYLKGVVPLEIGTTAYGDAAAVEAQAVTARSYAVMHLAGPERPYDMLATVQDQVYGGVGAETSIGSQSVDATAGLVLLYDGRVVNAPYHSTCGGSTAAPEDVWRTRGEPYLQRVSDQIPGTDRYYCDGAPKFRWTRTLTGEQLRQSVSRYVRSLPGGSGGVGVVRAVTVTDVTPARRVATLTIDTDRGRWALRGNEMRAALRLPSGELLYSTYFSIDATMSRSGEGVASLTIYGGGNGHGVGMCQAGAIGRARAGQDFRTILATYYPGTTVGVIE